MHGYKAEKALLTRKVLYMDFKDLPAFYQELDSRYYVTNNELNNATYTNVDSNFVFSAEYARHRWFNYKEGFSPVLVEKIFEEYDLNEGSVVCDPFCGAGTTLLVAKAKGMDSIGFEVNPFAALITRIKTANYEDKDIKEFKNILRELSVMTIVEEITLPENEYLRRIFEPEMLIVQLNIRDHIKRLNPGKAKDLLFFAWICTLEDCSLYRKAGNGLKVKRKPPVYEPGAAFEYALGKIQNKADSMIEDYTEEDNGILPKLYIDSVTTLEEHVPEETIDLVLFSPPYANCFDYTKIYYLELWFGEFVNSPGDQKEIRMKSLRSHCHATWPERYTEFYMPELNDEILPLLREQKLWTNRIPDMLNGYFADMEEALKQIYQTLKKGGHCAIVVSNSAYAGIVIPTDVFLAIIAEKIGFKVQEIAVERLIITSSQQYKKTEHIRKYLRESIVKLEK